MKSYRDRVFITWLPYSRRSQTLAENFGAKPIFFGYLAGKHNIPKAVLRYTIMTIHTIGYVILMRPKVVFVINQPVFLPLILFALSQITGVKYVIDSHSGMFIKAQWKWSLPLMKYAYRHSLFSIVTNQSHKELTESWGAKIEVLGALSVDEVAVKPFSRPEDPAVVIIGSFASDEPTKEIIEACRKQPDIKFFMTGAIKNAPKELISNAPENLKFTDFLTLENYVGLVQSMDAAIILVTNDDVMQRGAYEAMSWAVPIITSDWKVLRDSFYRGAVFVDNTPDEIVCAVKEIISNLDEYKKEITALRLEHSQVWDKNIAGINAYIEEYS